jgi:protein-disulfide isomerase
LKNWAPLIFQFSIFKLKEPMTHHNSDMPPETNITIDNHSERLAMPDANSPAYIIAAAILVGSLLISATIFYSLKSMQGVDIASASKTQGGVSPTPTPTPTQAVKEFDIVVRGDAPTMGSKDAPVTMVEFSDFQCPYCKRFFDQTFAQIKKDYIDTGKVRLVYMHFPLDFHINAQKSGEAAECANRQGKFWEYHDLLFKNSQPDGAGLDLDSLNKYAVQIGLNMSQFNQCLNNGETAEIVKADMEVGKKAGVTGTPGFNINKKLAAGAQPFTSFQKIIDEALKK